MSKNIENENAENFDFKEAYGDKLMDHDYDDIMELNNPAPKWVMAIWYISILFSIYYAAYYFILDGPTQIDEYTEASAEHDKEYASANASLASLELLSDGAAIAEGKTIYKEMNCAICHGANGEGNAIGPNLTDNAWINGCDFSSVMDVIKNGRPTKGMTAFKAQIPDVKIQKVASYLLKELLGTNPDNAKEPQGEECN
ncbi:MAG: c-type cytochrome [Bacteroidota bacterium]|nr:c-type cytochrome [Bacteroidota bacterium]